MKRNLIIKVLAFTMLFNIIALAQNSDDIVGLWYSHADAKNRIAVIEIFKENNKYYAYSFAYTNSNDVVYDVNNPKKELKNLPLKGLVYLYDLEFKNGEWKNGKIYNPEQGKVYNAKIDLSSKQFAISVGDNNIRAELFNRIIEKGGSVVNLIHPSAIVSKYSKLGIGVCVHALSVVSADTIVGDNCVISHHDLLTHGVRMGNHCFLASNVVLGANTIMEDYSFIGSGATVISNKVGRLGKYSYIGAGAVVTKSVKEGCIVAGNPAKVFIKKINEV